jgi:hypothetical protein
MVDSANAAVTSEILKSNGPGNLQVVLHPNGTKVFGDHNIAFKWARNIIVCANPSFLSSPARPWACT